MEGPCTKCSFPLQRGYSLSSLSTPLMCAGYNGHEQCVKAWLRQAGADVNTRDADGKSALIIMILKGYYKCAELLVQAGADVNVVDKNGNTPLVCAARNGHGFCVNLLLDAGADVNMAAQDKKSPLIIAVLKGYYECVGLLLRAGADVNTADINGNTALMWAAANDEVQCVQQLIEAGADANCTGGANNNTALVFAARYGHERCIELLLNAGADVNLVKGGLSALIAASIGGHEKCVELLLKAGADVNVKANNTMRRTETDIMQITALLAAAESCNTGCVRMLLKAGAHINTPNKPGHNALRYHLEKSRDVDREIAMMLFAAGDKFDQTPIKKRDYRGRIRIIDTPKYLDLSELELCLKHICREAIRSHFLEINPHLHLFDRVPPLGLPTSLSEYVLYHVSLH